MSYYEFGIDNTPACYLTNLIIAITNIFIFINIKQKPINLLDIVALKLFYLSDTITHLCGFYYHLFIGVNELINNPDYLWILITGVNDFSRNIIIFSFLINRLYISKKLGIIFSFMLSLFNIYNTYHFPNKMLYLNTLLNFNKYWIHIINGILLKNIMYLCVGIFGLCHELMYILYRIIFKNIDKDEEYDGVLSQSFNHNAVYHLNWALYNYLLYYVLTNFKGHLNAKRVKLM